MQCLPVTLPILAPPKADLLSVLDTALPALQPGDVVAISSKVVAIAEGCCVSVGSVDKADLVRARAQLTIPRPGWSTPLTVAEHTFLGAAGVDESNGNGYYITLPPDCFASAQRLHAWLAARVGSEAVGVVITDSRSQPFRHGAFGVALAWWGIAPLESHIGSPDLFGRRLRYERSNLVDGMAAAATLVMGETDRAQPVVILRDVPDLTFTAEPTRDELFATPEEDVFRVLFEPFGYPPAAPE